jgi:hypothetical protein
MLLFIIHIEQCTNKIRVFSDVMLYGLAESSLLPVGLKPKYHSFIHSIFHVCVSFISIRKSKQDTQKQW